MDLASTRLLLKGLRYRGWLSRVAEDLDLDVSHVMRVAQAERQSPRVEAALLRELRRIESEFAV